MSQTKKGQSQEMDDLLNCKEALSVTREGTDACQNKSESKTTLGFSNQQIPLKTNYMPNMQINQTQVAASSLSSPLENQSKVQDVSNKQFFPQNQQSSSVNPVEFTQCYMNPMLFQQQPYNMHPQFMNPIHFQTQKQFQTPSSIFQNSNQLYQQSNIPFIQTIQPSPFQSYQVIYSPINIQTSPCKGKVPEGQHNQIQGHQMIQNPNAQNSFDNWQINSNISQKQASLNLQQQMGATQLTQQQNMNNSIIQQINHENTLLIDNKQKNITQISANKQIGQTCLLQSEQEQNKNLNLFKKEISRKNNSPNTDQNSSIWNNCLDDEQNIQIKSQENNNINDQFKRNRNQNFKQERKGVSKGNINRIQDFKESEISIERFNSQKSNQSSIDQQEKFKRKTCSYRLIKRNESSLRKDWQIVSSFIPQQLDMGSPCSQKRKGILDQSQKEQILKTNAYTHSSFISKSQINEKNIISSKNKEIQPMSSKDSTYLKKRKHDESQIQNLENFSSNYVKKIQRNEENKTIISQYSNNCTQLANQKQERNSQNSQNSYSSEQNSQKDNKISAINSSLHNTRMNNNQPELKVKKQKSPSDHISVSSLEESPIKDQYILRQKSKPLSNSEQNQQGIYSQKLSQNEYQKSNVSELDEIKDDCDFLHETLEDDQWEDSFFQQMKTNTKTFKKSFFLISNYKKKLFQKLNPEDQLTLTQMKQSKKFNFSKNVIKQFLKVMNSEVNYVYKLSSNYSSENKSEINQQCKQPVQNKNDCITDTQSNSNQPEFNFKQSNKIDYSQKNNNKHFIEFNNQFSTLSSNLSQNKDNNKQPFQLSNSTNSVQKEKVYEKILNPSRYQLNKLRQNIKEFLTFHSYTHSSIKKIIIHNYYSLYFRDFLENYCNEWVDSGKTKYKEEQKTMIAFLKMCLRNRKLLIFLSQHDQLKESEQD